MSIWSVIGNFFSLEVKNTGNTITKTSTKEKRVLKIKNLTFVNHIANNNQLSNELKEELIERVERKENIDELSFKDDAEKVKNIKSIEHLKDIYDLKDFSLMSNIDVYEVIKNNNLFEKMIDNQNTRERKKIKENLEFLQESNHEEKTALIWMYISNLSWNKNNFNTILKYREKILEKYNLEKNSLNFESLALFNKFGVFEQGTMTNYSFTERNKSNTEEKLGKSLDEIYQLLPELKIIFSEDESKGAFIKFTSLMSWIENLSYAAQWLLMNIGLSFK